MLTCLSVTLESRDARHPRPRSLLRPYEAQCADDLRSAAASSVTPASLCTPLALDTPSGSIEAPLQFVFQRACTATGTRDRETQTARATAWPPDPADSSSSSLMDAGLPVPGEAIYSRPSECPAQPSCPEATGGVSCVRRPRKAMSSATVLAPGPRPRCPDQQTREGVRMRPLFERVQMRARLHPIHRQAALEAPAEPQAIQLQEAPQCTA